MFNIYDYFFFEYFDIIIRWLKCEIKWEKWNII